MGAPCHSLTAVVRWRGARAGWPSWGSRGWRGTMGAWAVARCGGQDLPEQVHGHRESVPGQEGSPGQVFHVPAPTLMVSKNSGAHTWAGAQCPILPCHLLTQNACGQLPAQPVQLQSLGSALGPHTIYTHLLSPASDLFYLAAPPQPPHSAAASVYSSNISPSPTAGPR